MMTSFGQFGIGALFNLVVAVVIVRFIYYPRTQAKPFVLTFLTLNTVMYFLVTMLQSTEFGVGVGFGLFAIFSILRYRTDPIPMREMTYIFILIALPVVNAMMDPADSLAQLIAANGLVLILLYVLESEWGFHFESRSRITYDRIDLIVPGKRDELLADLRRRTGLPVTRVEIKRMDFLRDAAEMTLFYDAPDMDDTTPQELPISHDTTSLSPAKAGIARPSLQSVPLEHSTANRADGENRS